MHHTIPLFPLSTSLFPEGMLQLQIFEVRYLDLIKRCLQQQQPFGVVSIKHGKEVQVPGEVPTLHGVGCLAHIRKFEPVQPTFFRVLCQRGVRFNCITSQPLACGRVMLLICRMTGYAQILASVMGMSPVASGALYYAFVAHVQLLARLRRVSCWRLAP